MVIRARFLLAAAFVLPLALAGCTSPGKAKPEAARATAASPSAAPCTPVPGKSFPPLLTGFDPGLATAPTEYGALTQPKDLAVTVLIQGMCAKVESGQTISVNYVGLTLSDGKVFDSSWKGQQTFDFEIGKGNVIQGFERGLIGVAAGSRVRIDMPATMAYGDNPEHGEPKGALRFIVDVLNTKA